MDGLVVAKWGGSSIVDVSSLDRIDYIVRQEPQRRVLTFSAAEEVTDMLVDLSDTRDTTMIPGIMKRYQALAPDMDLTKLAATLADRVNDTSQGDFYGPSIWGFGEEASTTIIADAHGYEYVNPKDLFVVEGEPGDAKILLAESAEKIRRRLSGNSIYAVPGFFVVNEDGTINTLRRNMSDYTNSVLSAILNASLSENWTNTPGILDAQPNVVPNPSKIDEITYREFGELVYLDFKMFPGSLKPLDDARIPLHVRNSFEPDATGTLVTHERSSDPNKPITGVAYKGDLCAVSLYGLGLHEQPGILADASAVFAKNAISVEFPFSDINSVVYVVSQEDLNEHGRMNDLTRELESLIEGNSEVAFEQHQGAIVLAGQEMKNARYLSTSIDLVLARERIDVNHETGGRSADSRILIVPDQQGRKATNLLYDTFVRNS